MRALMPPMFVVPMLAASVFVGLLAFAAQPARAQSNPSADAIIQ